MIEKDIIVIGGGIAGLTANCGLKFGSLGQRCASI